MPAFRFPEWFVTQVSGRQSKGPAKRSRYLVHLRALSKGSRFPDPESGDKLKLAHRVEEADIRAREPPLDRRGQMPDLLDCLRRLRRDTNSCVLLERHHPLLIGHHVEVVEIAGQP